MYLNRDRELRDREGKSVREKRERKWIHLSELWLKQWHKKLSGIKIDLHISADTNGQTDQILYWFFMVS